MPIELPPLTRRQFLHRSLAAGAALAIGPTAWKARAADPTSTSETWALLSDIHLAADAAREARGINMAEHLKTVTGEVCGLANLPAGVFINGDCAFDSGETADYASLIEQLKPIRKAGLPVRIGLGNHDNRERFWESFKEEQTASKPLPSRQVALVPTRFANWFILDSLEKTRSTPGLLGPDQLEWLGKTLDSNATKPAIVMIHHNPGISGNMGLKDTVALFEVIRPRRQVKAYIYGHTHAWKVETDTSGLHLINLPPVGYVFREGEPSGWVSLTLTEKTGVFELSCIDKSHKAHGEKSKLEWRV